MFGPDTQLMVDAFQIGALALAAGAGAAWLFMRRRSRKPCSFNNAVGTSRTQASDPDSLEQRVRVLERIATDPSHDLAREIDALSDKPSGSGTS
jgi:hypothetical protein